MAWNFVDFTIKFVQALNQLAHWIFTEFTGVTKAAFELFGIDDPSPAVLLIGGGTALALVVGALRRIL